LLYADTATSLAKLSDVAVGKVLKSGGVGVAPSWGSLSIVNADVSASAAIAYSKLALTGSILEADLGLTDLTTANVTSTKHGFVPKSPAAATQFLNGAATPAWAQVKDSDLSTSDITTNDVTTAKHGFIVKAPNDTAQVFRGDAAWGVGFAQLFRVA
jgi:hypothetical protein